VGAQRVAAEAAASGVHGADGSTPTQHIQTVPLWGPQGELSRMYALCESPQLFWNELTATLDEFALIIRQSREQIERLTAELARRNEALVTLKAKTLELEAQLRPVESGGRPAPADEVESLPSANTEPGTSGIWRRLARLERD